MSVQYNSFYAQRIRKELDAKSHFDKVVHLNKQAQMASTVASGFSNATSTSQNTIVRNRAFANQESMMTNMKKPGRPPLYFVNSSNGLVASDPNTLRDMGTVRNCVYQLDDVTENVARNVTWRDILQNDEQLSKMIKSQQQSITNGFVRKGSASSLTVKSAASQYSAQQRKQQRSEHGSESGPINKSQSVKHLVKPSQSVLENIQRWQEQRNRLDKNKKSGKSSVFDVNSVTGSIAKFKVHNRRQQSDQISHVSTESAQNHQYKNQRRSRADWKKKMQRDPTDQESIAASDQMSHRGGGYGTLQPRDQQQDDDEYSAAVELKSPRKMVKLRSTKQNGAQFQSLPASPKRLFKQKRNSEAQMSVTSSQVAKDQDHHDPYGRGTQTAVRKRSSAGKQMLHMHYDQISQASSKLTNSVMEFGRSNNVTPTKQKRYIDKFAQSSQHFYPRQSDTRNSSRNSKTRSAVETKPVLRISGNPKNDSEPIFNPNLADHQMPSTKKHRDHQQQKSKSYFNTKEAQKSGETSSRVGGKDYQQHQSRKQFKSTYDNQASLKQSKVLLKASIASDRVSQAPSITSSVFSQQNPKRKNQISFNLEQPRTQMVTQTSSFKQQRSRPVSAYANFERQREIQSQSSGGQLRAKSREDAIKQYFVAQAECLGLQRPSTAYISCQYDTLKSNRKFKK